MLVVVLHIIINERGRRWAWTTLQVAQAHLHRQECFVAEIVDEAPRAMRIFEPRPAVLVRWVGILRWHNVRRHENVPVRGLYVGGDGIVKYHKLYIGS